MTDFSSKYGPWAVVTGATSGIGQEIARELAARGLNIVLVARGQPALDAAAAEIQSRHGVQTRKVSIDLSAKDGLETLFKATSDIEVGLCVTAAGVEVTGSFEKTNAAAQQRVIDLNVTATMQLTHHFVPAMVARKRGGVLMLASLSGQMPNPYLSSYAGTKAYVVNFGASLYGELRPKGVDVTVLSPGLTSTPMSKGVPIDWKKTPMKAMLPRAVALCGINALGHKALAVPGRRNRMMALMARLSPMSMGARISETMMRKAIRPDVL